MSYRPVWAVSSGEYSDYSVSLLFTTEELAEQHAERMNGQEGYRGHFVEEFQLWDETPPTYTVYYRHGLVRAAQVEQVVERSDVYFGAPSAAERIRVHTSDQTGPGSLYLNVYSTDLERLNKVWGERVAKIQAELAGIT